jgi:molybdate transport system regulatory protein
MAAQAPRLSLRIDLDAGRLGPGKVELLEHIGRKRSLAAAARAMGMSYRRAWELLAALNEMFEEELTASHPGRNVEGSTELTPFGARVVAIYRALERRALPAAAPGLHELSAATRPARRSPRKARA